MNVFSMRAIRGTAALAATWLVVAAATAQTGTTRIVGAANAFLSTLDAKQRQSVMYAFDDEKQRATWSNFPTAMVPRGGISLKEMTAVQRAAAMAVVSAALSPRGFEKVQQIMEGDEVLKSDGGNGGGPGGGGGRGPRGPAGGPPPGNGGTRRVVGIAGGLAVVVAVCLVRIFTTSLFLESLRRMIRGCCSSAGIIWR